MLIGIVGKPNVGKSTFFSAATMASAEIAAYPFTTIKPNKGVGYLRAPCPEKHFGVKCQPRNSACDNGTRMVPVELLDVAGLVPDAWQGKGLGNQFLDDLRQADAFIHIIDASGSTDSDGNPVPAGTHDPLVDVKFLEKEIAYWMKGIIEKGFEKSARMAHLEGQKMEDVIHERLTGLGIPMPAISAAMRESNLPANPMSWKDEEMLRLADNIRRLSKPILIAYNKSDVASDENIKRLSKLPDYISIATCAETELALKKAAKAKLVNYSPG
jgi:ribosome-binding ATPase YchF (GTP1/OBG family)